MSCRAALLDGINGQKAFKAKLLKQGWKIFDRGWPDLLVVDPCSETAFFVEVKTGNSMRSKHQIAMHDVLDSVGISVGIARYSTKDGSFSWTANPLPVKYRLLHPKSNKSQNFIFGDGI